MASYSDDTARYVYKENKSSVIERLEKTLKLECHWFSITISLLGFVRFWLITTDSFSKLNVYQVQCCDIKRIHVYYSLSIASYYSDKLLCNAIFGSVTYPAGLWHRGCGTSAKKIKYKKTCLLELKMTGKCFKGLFRQCRSIK